MWVIVEHAGRRLRLAAVPTAAGCWVAYPGGAALVPRAPVPAGGASTGPSAAASPAAGAMRQLRAPMSGRVIEVGAVAGAAVAAHSTLLVLEAMKMQYSVRAPGAATVVDLSCAVGDWVEIGALLVALEPAA